MITVLVFPPGKPYLEGLLGVPIWFDSNLYDIPGPPPPPWVTIGVCAHMIRRALREPARVFPTPWEEQWSPYA